MRSGNETNAKHVQDCFSAKKDRESRFHHCGGRVKLVEACLRAGKERESSFHHRGGSLKLGLTCLDTKKVQETTVQVLLSLCPPASVAGMFEKAVFSTVEVW